MNDDMTVGELIAELQTFPKDTLIVMSSDPEGNRFSGADEVGDGNFALDERELYAEEDMEPEDHYEKVAVIWPMH